MSRNSENERRKSAILDYVNAYYDESREIPSVRDVAAGTGISVATVHRHLTAMKESGELRYSGRRSINTDRMNLEKEHICMPVRGYVACGPGQEEEEQILEYIRLPESMVGVGDLFALIAKGESMVDAGINPGDYVIVRRQSSADIGDVIVALLNGKNNLKVLGFDEKSRRYVLKSCNADKETYADIPVDDELTIQGVAVCVTHRLGKVR